MVVHTSAGAAVFAMLLVVGRRRNWPKGDALPHSLPLTVIGAGILWFGWFGFNAGDGLQANSVAAQALVNTQLAAAAGVIVWLIVERARTGHATVLGGVTGAVAGLATITPCAGYVSAYSALLIGIIAAVVCYPALKIKSLLRLDDALDVIAVHFAGGALGSLLVGLFAQRAINPVSANGLFYGGGLTLLGHQVIAVICVAAFSFVLSWLIAMAIQKTIGLRVNPADEARLDEVQQGMAAYHLDHIWSLPGAAATSPATTAAGAEAAAGALPVPATGTAAVSAVTPGVRLVTALVDPYDVDYDALTRRLASAGGSSIVVSDVHLYSGGQSQVVRAETKAVDFPDRLRVEVLVTEVQLPEVVAALRQASRDRSGEYIQITRPETVKLD
jgi:nitrogen regulatory protein PII